LLRLSGPAIDFRVRLQELPEPGGYSMDAVTVALLGIIVVSYVVGSLSSSVDTEQKLPHRY